MNAELMLHECRSNVGRKRWIHWTTSAQHAQDPCFGPCGCQTVVSSNRMRESRHPLRAPSALASARWSHRHNPIAPGRTLPSRAVRHEELCPSGSLETAMLFQLPDDAAYQLAALLQFDDLEALCSVAQASHASAFRANFRSRACILVPPKREDAAQSLVRNLTPSQLSSFQWIQVATPWHVDLLSQSTTVAAIHSIRVVPIHRDDVAALDQICVKLPQLLHLRRLDMKRTHIRDVSPLASMTQLRELDLSSSGVQDIACLASLTDLEALTLQATLIGDITCIGNMQRLRKLTFWRWKIDRVVLPSLQSLPSLQELTLGNLIITGLSELLPAPGSLKKLVADSVYPSGQLNNDASEERLQWAAEFASRLYALETIDIRSHRDLIGQAIQSFRNMPYIRSIRHAIDWGIRPIPSLMYLEELHLGVDIRQVLEPPAPDEFEFLRHLPKLKIVSFHLEPKFDFLSYDERKLRYQQADSYAQAFFDVLEGIPGVRRLDYAGYTDGKGGLAKLHHLEDLSLRDCVPRLKSFDWIEAFTSLRSLTVRNSTRGYNYTAIGRLTQLESFSLDDSKLPSDGFAFVSQLVNLKTLTLRGQVFDFSCLRGLKCLKSLTIWSLSQKSTKVYNEEVIGTLQTLRHIFISHIREAYVLRQLPRLKSATIAWGTDCTPLTEYNHPTLLHVVHDGRNCLWEPRPSCFHRHEWLRNQQASST